MASPTYTLRTATLPDIPGMVDVWYAAFNTPAIFEVFPNTAAGHAWAAVSLVRGLLEPSLNTVHMVMTENVPDKPEERGRVVAFSRWVVHPGGGEVPGWRERWMERLAEGMREEVVGEGFFLPMARQHALVMGERPHYFLEVIATHDQYRKQGLASQLLDWGAAAADARGWESYLDATPSAQVLYEKHGYVAQAVRDEKAHSVAMVRPSGLGEKTA